MTARDKELELFEKLLVLPALRGIGDVALLDLARNSRIERYPAATVLRADGHQVRRLYLLAGTVELRADNKSMAVIAAGSERAATPIFRLHTAGLMAICQSKVEFLSIDDAVFEKYVTMANLATGDIMVAEYEKDTGEPEVVTEAHLDFIHSEVDLPSMPDIAARIYDLLKQDDVDIRQVADIIKNDPIIAARTVQVANSAMYRTPVAIESIKDAITRIGLTATRAIVMSVVLNNLFVPRLPSVQQLFRRFYHHSIRVAAIAHVLAKQTRGFNPEMALLAGLVHDIGVVPILIEADHNKHMAENTAELGLVLQQQSARVGAALLRQWSFDEMFVTVAREAEDWRRQVAQADYCDLIQVAQLHCAMVGGRKIEAPNMNEVPAFARLGLDSVDPQRIVKEAKHEIHEVIDLLS